MSDCLQKLWRKNWEGTAPPMPSPPALLPPSAAFYWLNPTSSPRRGRPRIGEGWTCRGKKTAQDRDRMGTGAKVDRVPGEMDVQTATVQPERGAHRGLGAEAAHPLGV